MKKLDLSQDSDSKIFEYLLLIPPSESVSKKAAKIKNTFSEVYGCTHAADLSSNLTMVNFLQRESMEFRVINCFEKFTQYVEPFMIELDGFGEFPPHTIYLKLTKTETFEHLVKNIRSKFQRILKISDMIKPTYTLKPHLTIARKITGEQHQNIWPVYKKEYFNESFVADEMVLIKREVDPFTLKAIGKYKAVRHFPFLGKHREEQLMLAL